MRFGASGSDMGSRHQEQNREGGKAQSKQYMASWAGLLHFCIRACYSGDRNECKVLKCGSK
jgi:hypothetical protein